MGGQPAGGQLGIDVDLEAERVDQPAQRRDPPGVHGRNPQLVEQPVAANAEQVRHRHADPALREDRVHAGLDPGPQRDQLGPVPDQLPQLPGRRRGDPRLRQPTHPQQVSQIRRVAFVVLHPPVRESLDSQRMREMYLRTRLGQHIRGPIPAVGRFQHHLRGLTPRRDLLGQGERIVVDPRHSQPLTGLRLPHDHRAPSMQIDTHELLSHVRFHQGPPSS